MFSALLARSWAALPGQCAICRRWPARTVCDDCVDRFAQPHPRCRTCALPLPAGVPQCGQCLTHPPPLDACHAAVAYAYPWSDCISQYKFGHQPGWAEAFATLLRSTPWAEPALDAATWVLPMPLSAQRLRERGFNQAHEIARRLAPHKTRTDLLQRWLDTPPQRQLNRAERALNVRGAYGVAPLLAHQLQDAQVVLVDDVMTSGASLHAAAVAVRAAGAARVTALVVARTDAPH